MHIKTLQSLAHRFYIKTARDSEYQAIINKYHDKYPHLIDENGSIIRKWKGGDPFESDPEEALSSEHQSIVVEMAREIQELGQRDRQQQDIDQGQQEFDASENEVKQFYDNKKLQEDQLKSKSVFSAPDADKIINASLAEIKNLLAKNRLLPASLSFIFYSNGNVGVSSNNMKAANLIRRDLIMPISLNFKHYLTTYKKYLPETISKMVNFLAS